MTFAYGTTVRRTLRETTTSSQKSERTELFANILSQQKRKSETDFNVAALVSCPELRARSRSPVLSILGRSHLIELGFRFRNHNLVEFFQKVVDIPISQRRLH